MRICQQLCDNVLYCMSYVPQWVLLEIQLPRVPSVNERLGKEEPDRTPLQCCCVSFPVINPVRLFSAVYVQPRLPLVHFSRHNK